jgi:uncharacterized membrane protein
MEAFAIEWLNLLFRWAHLIVGVGWIGTSFYFIALDLSLRKRDGQASGVFGSAWLVHGGGFYDVQKYTVAPKQLPDDLVWYKWEAYLTWVTGFALIILQYYYNASAYLIDPSVMALSNWEAIGISLVSLAGGWFFYNTVCKLFLGRSTMWLGVTVFMFIVAAGYGYTHVFSGRGAFIHVGAIVGTMMAFNVFRIIIPNQKKIVASLIAGEEPDPTLGQIGKQRSVHNNYLTLPVLLMMVSNHYPFITNHPQSWLVIAFILIAGACFRHFLNSHEAAHGKPIEEVSNYSWALLVGAIAVAFLVILTAPIERDISNVGNVRDANIIALSQKHCVSCHAAVPTNEFFTEAPKGVKLETVEELTRYAALIKAQAVDTDIMPLGNETGMTDQERAELAVWIANLDGSENK